MTSTLHSSLLVHLTWPVVFCNPPGPFHQDSMQSPFFISPSIETHAGWFRRTVQEFVTATQEWNGHQGQCCKYTFVLYVRTGYLLHLTRGLSRLLAFDLVPFLQNGSRPSCDFLAKILCVHTSLFAWNTQFYVTCSALLLHTSCIEHLLLYATAQ
jgi:hypothetical protein